MIFTVHDELSRIWPNWQWLHTTIYREEYPVEINYLDLTLIGLVEDQSVNVHSHRKPSSKNSFWHATGCHQTHVLRAIVRGQFESQTKLYLQEFEKEAELIEERRRGYNRVEVSRTHKQARDTPRIWLKMGQPPVETWVTPQMKNPQVFSTSQRFWA